AFQMKKEFDKAMTDWNETVRLAPEDCRGFYLRGQCWLVQKQQDKALKDLNEVVRLQPKWPEGFALRGSCRSRQKDYANAIKDFDEALGLNARCLAALNGKAWLLASCTDEKIRDGKAALALATQVCE